MIHLNVSFIRLDFVSRTESWKGEIVKIFRPRGAILREKLRKCNNFEKSLKFQRVAPPFASEELAELKRLVNVVNVTLPGVPECAFSPQIRYFSLVKILLYSLWLRRRKNKIVIAVIIRRSNF